MVKKNHQGKKTTCCFEFTVSLTTRRFKTWMLGILLRLKIPSAVWLEWFLASLDHVFFLMGKKAQKSLCFRCLVHFFGGGREREKKHLMGRCQGVPEPQNSMFGGLVLWSPSHQCFSKKESQVVFESWACWKSLACFIALHRITP